MNQRDPQQESQRQRYQIPPGVSEETRRCIEQAQARLDLFATKPEYRSAYEREVLEMMEHNTQLENSFEEGREEGREEGIAIGEARVAEKMKLAAEKIKLAVESLRRAGVDDEQIASSLNLNADERATLMTSER